MKTIIADIWYKTIDDDGDKNRTKIFIPKDTDLFTYLNSGITFIKLQYMGDKPFITHIDTIDVIQELPLEDQI